MIKASELKAWVATLDDDLWVAIDEDGLTIEVVNGAGYIEIGGVPEEDDDE